MHLEDRFAIQDVVAHYAYTYDTQDATGFAALFTEDAIWEAFPQDAVSPEVRLESRAAIHAWVTQRFRKRSGVFTSRHHQSGLLFEALTAESARTRIMVLITHQSIREDAPRPTLSGVYHDQWRKIAPGWRLAHRVLRYDSRIPTLQG